MLKHVFFIMGVMLNYVCEFKTKMFFVCLWIRSKKDGCLFWFCQVNQPKNKTLHILDVVCDSAKK